jgi:peptide/nickel transport system substrate-binding protein
MGGARVGWFRRLGSGLAAGAVLAAAWTVAVPAAVAAPMHALAMHGEPAMPADFDHFPFANPAAPKGGRVTYGSLGSFDSLNPFIVKGTPARGLRDGGQENYVYESLMVRGLDEPFTLYCLVCATVEVPEDRSWVEFKLRPEAAFSDGHPLRAEDVVHSLTLLRDYGRPNTAAAYKKVVRTETPDPLTVRFVFADGSDREIALIMGLMPLLPKHAMSAEDFDKTSLAPPIGSGPYVVADVKAGSQLLLKRNPDYWARDLAVKRGFDNFDEIRIDYYRLDTAMFEAFKAGQIDIYPEGDANRWRTAYDFPAVADGRVVKEGFTSTAPKTMTGIVLNTRRPLFADVRVREALTRLYDFEWVNANLYFGLYRRTTSFFEGSDLASVGRPADARERALLAPFPGAVRADVLDGTWRPAATDGSGRDRTVLKGALDLLTAAGWKLDRGQLKDHDGRPFRFELIMTSASDQEKMALAWQRTLKTLGIELTVRTIDSSEYQSRRTSYDFDATFWAWAASSSPGNEQNFRWSSTAADIDGTFNLAGVKSPAVDAMIVAMLNARSRTDFVAAVRAFDRLLISGFYVVPLQHQPEIWIARWTRIARPERGALVGPVTGAWWVAPEAAP